MTSNRLFQFAAAFLCITQVIVLVNIFVIEEPKESFVCRGVFNNPSNIVCFQQ